MLSQLDSEAPLPPFWGRVVKLLADTKSHGILSAAAGVFISRAIVELTQAVQTQGFCINPPPGTRIDTNNLWPASKCASLWIPPPFTKLFLITGVKKASESSTSRILHQ